MKTGIRNGIIMMALYFLMLFIITLLPTGDINRIIEIHENRGSLEWQADIAIYLGLFVVGFIHGWTRTPISVLLIGFSLVPLIFWLLILPVLAITNSPRYVLALTGAVCTPSFAFIPTLVYWVIKKYSRPKKKSETLLVNCNVWMVARQYMYLGKTQISTK